MTDFAPLFNESSTPEEQAQRLGLALQRLKSDLIAHATSPLPPEEHWCFLLLPGRTQRSQLQALEDAGGQVMSTSRRMLTVVRFSPTHMPASVLSTALADENDTAYLLAFASAANPCNQQLCDWTDAVMARDTQDKNLPAWALLTFDSGSLLEETPQTDNNR